MHHSVFGIIFLLHSVNLVHHLSPPLSLSSIPDLKLTGSTNPSHHRSSPTHCPLDFNRTAFTQVHGLRTTLRYVLVLSLSSFSWRVCRTKLISASFWSHVNKIIIYSFSIGAMVVQVRADRSGWSTKGGSGWSRTGTWRGDLSGLWTKH